MAAALTNSDFNHRPSLTFLHGVIAGAVSSSVQFIASMFLSLPFPPETFFRWILAPVPGSLQSVAVENLGEYAKYGAFTVAIAAYIALYGLIASIVAVRSHRSVGKASSILLWIIPTIIGLVLELPLSSSYASLSTTMGWLLAAAVVLIANLTFSGVFLKLRNQQLINMQSRATAVYARRGFLKKATALIIVATAAVLGTRIAFSLLSRQPIVETENPIPVNPETSTTVMLSSSSTSTSLLNPSEPSECRKYSAIPEL